MTRRCGSWGHVVMLDNYLTMLILFDGASGVPTLWPTEAPPAAVRAWTGNEAAGSGGGQAGFPRPSGNAPALGPGAPIASLGQ